MARGKTNSEILNNKAFNEPIEVSYGKDIDNTKIKLNHRTPISPPTILDNSNQTQVIYDK
ncbi:hypothetical protein [Staphylococcus kloosii]|uniref:Uncharacterized protein n=1 Tax=Staphylococcus kloosii TaxID=29384 RepID=A0A151A5W6_9STAP|nr:hypothetical protein [Staphylococcus kloosii]AVQ36216.1 hypothetical protein C7J89_08735 [Staphylococcus kloosii]KYH14520.1 hypothetical protein A0131_06995 [Staphylococcus kloosii]PNZ04102.1 hypothetical protein CD136_09605 [Staphylococcus kloosii]PTJ75717.1 hypothetical protein BUZ59_09380 [Staphylococcus kloosii]SUM49297.1 Uncharacterised protein [Staphylococcus kloosii]